MTYLIRALDADHHHWKDEKHYMLFDNFNTVTVWYYLKGRSKPDGGAAFTGCRHDHHVPLEHAR